MEHSLFIARIFGLCYLVMGIELLCNRKVLERVMEDIAKNAALLFAFGLFALVVGFAIMLTHNVWVTDWRVIITVLGWMGAAKGAWMIIFPGSVPKITEMYLRNKTLLTLHAIVALCLGALLTFLGFF